MDESYAIKLCLKYHDPAGFEFLVNKYRREAYFHARSFLGNQDDAADACQESFAKAFAAIPKLTYLDAFYPWFYRILKNCCLNMIRKKKTFASILDTIPGIGPKRKRALLRQFGSVQAIREAPEEELAKTKGMTKRLTVKIKQYL